MESNDPVGTLAGGVAHDFNNILTIIFGACALLEKSAMDQPEQMALLTRISGSAERAARLTESLLAFSRRQNLDKQPEDLICVIRSLQELLDQISAEEIMLATYLPEAPLTVLMDRSQIEQVLIHMAANACDAMPLGGILHIAVSIETDQGHLRQAGIARPGAYALITIADTGEGIDEAIRQRVFEPYYTTKTIGEGTGLGLAMAYGIIHLHDGTINLSSQPGVGTTFDIYLPLHDGSDIGTAQGAALSSP